MTLGAAQGFAGFTYVDPGGLVSRMGAPSSQETLVDDILPREQGKVAFHPWDLIKYIYIK